MDTLIYGYPELIRLIVLQVRSPWDLKALLRSHTAFYSSLLPGDMKILHIQTIPRTQESSGIVRYLPGTKIFHGKCRYINGDIAKYKKGKRHGLQRSSNGEGDTIKTWFVNDYLRKYRHSNKKGIMIESLNRYEGTIHGMYRRYYPEGNLRAEYWYVYGYLYSVKEWDRDGILTNYDGCEHRTNCVPNGYYVLYLA